MKEFVGKNQYGFISKRSTKQAILRMDIKREHFTEHGKRGKLVMIDFSKAFNKISRSAIKEALKEAGVSKKLIWKISKLKGTTLLRVGDKNIKTKNGVRQGCCLSATLFIAVMALLTKDIPELHVVYADDLCIVIDNNMVDDSVINSIKVKGERFGLIINEDKTEILELS